ncbi:MAG: ATP-binding protein, partial [Burkholderiales bacterium]
MLYQPPKTIQDVLYHIDFDQPLELNDPRFVETQAARGSEKTLRRLAVKLGVDLTSGNFTPATKRHVLLFGHTGSGKTTQLR